jgi:hypothetical protein
MRGFLQRRVFAPLLALLRQSVTPLELGLSLWIGTNYPAARITAVSNSRTQKEHIDGEARRGLRNLEVLTCDVNRPELPAGSFDRVVSVEMFEHMRNHETLLARIASWMAPGATLFVHIFTHLRIVSHWQVPGWQLADQRGLVAEHGPPPGRTHARAGPHLRRRPGAPLVGLLARVLHVLRRAVGLCRRPRMAGVALPLRETLSLNGVQKR